MKTKLLATICCTAGLLLALSPIRTSPQLQKLDNTQMSNIVGSVNGYCCKPGRRYGCDASNFPPEYTQCSKDTTSCSGDLVMHCNNASCEASQASDTCNYSPQLVGRNRCKFTKQNCGTEQVCEEVTVGYEPYYCWDSYYGWVICGYDPVVETQCHDVDKFECVPSLKTSWANDPSPVIRSVCDGGTTCTINYGACEG